MDKEYRKKAQDASWKAHSARLTAKERLRLYRLAIDYYSLIDNKLEEDFRAMSKIYRTIAVSHFNINEYDKAVEFYERSIESSLQCPLNDNEYRILTRRYIDLSDSCYHCYNQDAGQAAFNNAIIAFNLIKDKTSDERKLDTVNNPREFRQYFEQHLCHTSYLESFEQKNHEELLTQKHEENALMSMLSGLSMDEVSKEQQEIEAMLQNLNVGKPAPPAFTPCSLFATPSESNYRTAAADFLRLTLSHVERGSVTDTIGTYKQALGALKNIHQPNEDDQRTIQSIENQITYLKQKSKTHSNQPLSQWATPAPAPTPSPSPSVIAIGWFGQSAAPSALNTSLADDDEECGMDLS